MNLKKFTQALSDHEKMILLDILKEELDSKDKKRSKLNGIKSWDI